MLEFSIPDYNPETLVRSITIEIEAPASLVWEVLTDVDNYPQWNPFCVAMKSTLEMGSPVKMTLANYAGGTGTYPHTEYVCAFVPERLLSWELRATELSAEAARRDQVIERISENRCSYFSTDAFFGENAYEMMRDHGAWVKRAFDDTAVALKERSESLYRDRRR